MISQRPAFQFRHYVLVLWMVIAGASDLLFASEPVAAHPGWSPIILPTGQYRAEIKSMPIESRPYRPLHFYGNTVRRNYYQNLSAQSLGTQQPASPSIVSPSINPQSIAVAPSVRRGRGLVARPLR
jgi:hypothetical protein